MFLESPFKWVPNHSENFALPGLAFPNAITVTSDRHPSFSISSYATRFDRAPPIENPVRTMSRFPCSFSLFTTTSFFTISFANPNREALRLSSIPSDPNFRPEKTNSRGPRGLKYGNTRNRRPPPAPAGSSSLSSRQTRLDPKSTLSSNENLRVTTEPTSFELRVNEKVSPSFCLAKRPIRRIHVTAISGTGGMLLISSSWTDLLVKS
mmetsp:Transcript_15834/g.32125  ORF Transcript_15834/g.32125 Transcript_15834/m.32125 type:complete len:208 (+) Transcript_15834:416-1039(+)